MATKRGCAKRGKSAPRKKGGVCGKKLKRKSSKKKRR